MKLKELEIELQQWGEFKGRYVGKVQYEGAEGSVCMTLSPEVSEIVLLAVGKQIVSLTQQTAQNLANVIEDSVHAAHLTKAQSVPALEV